MPHRSVLSPTLLSKEGLSVQGRRRQQGPGCVGSYVPRGDVTEQIDVDALLDQRRCSWAWREGVVGAEAEPRVSGGVVGVGV